MKKVSSELEVFPWNSNFETGIIEIDDQHKELVRLLNKLAGCLIDDDDIEINRVFDELASYAEYHFQTEERVWSKYFGEDGWLKEHAKSHVDFWPQLFEIKEKDIEGPLHIVVERVVKFLIRWLAFHIVDSDRRMAMVIESINAGSGLSEAKRVADRQMGSSFHILTETILSMYDGLSSRTLELMRERVHRQAVEMELREANQRLKELATTDVLTGLHNRRYFNDVIARELRRSRRESSSLALILIDLDYFKQLNDRYGHSAGDYALSVVGACIKELCRRPGDFSFRLGGEEFSILVTDAPSLDQVGVFAERLRKAILDLQIPNALSEAGSVLTISLGAVLVSPVSGQSAEALMNRADENLYQAKHLGRNRAVISLW